MVQTAIGWDIHRKFSKISIRQVDDTGELKVLGRHRLEHDDHDRMRAWLLKLPKGLPVAMEAAFGWPWIADMVEECGLEPHLAHPPAVRVLAKHQAKSDRCDSDRLGEFLLTGILPESFLAPPAVREFRERMRFRMTLSRWRTAIKNRATAIIHRHGIWHEYADLFGKRGRQFLQEVALPEAAKFALSSLLDMLGYVEGQIGKVEAWMTEQLEQDEIVQLLSSIPGVGLVLSHVIKAEIGDIGRFPSSRHLASYAGLAPVSNDSAERHGRRRCSQACNRTLRWALIEAANTTVRMSEKAPRLCNLYQRLTYRGRANKAQAKVAIAHELCKLVYAIWNKRQPYTATPPPRPGSDKALTVPAPKKQQANRHRKQNRSSTILTAQASTEACKARCSRRAPKPPSGQPRHPMVRRQPKVDGQTRL